MVILTDCPLFEQSCPGRIGLLTPRPLNVWCSLYHAEIHMAPIFADHRFRPVVPRCVRTTRWGRGVSDPGRPGIVRLGRYGCYGVTPADERAGQQGTQSATCSHQEVGGAISMSEVPADAVPGVGAGRIT